MASPYAKYNKAPYLYKCGALHEDSPKFQGSPSPVQLLFKRVKSLVNEMHNSTVNSKKDRLSKEINSLLSSI